MNLSTVWSIILIGLICLTQTTLSNDCLEYVSPFNRLETRAVYCPSVSRKDKRGPTSDNMFNVDFECSSSDQNLCNKVKNVFVLAGKYITATINLKSAITVKAQFLDFCQEFGSCNDDTVTVLGSASPARLIPYQDTTDNKVRFYPQALYKQLDLKAEHPQFGPEDILARFNSRMTYWFEGDPSPSSSQERKVDMLYVVLHELIHGLGFTNSWNDYYNLQALTPAVGNMTNTPSQGNLATLTTANGRSQFFELIFDKFLVLLPGGTPLTSITDQLNQFQFSGTASSSDNSDFVNSFKASPQFKIAQDMFKQATTPKTIGFLTNSDLPLNTQLTQDQIQKNFVILETSLKPYQPSSSIGHVDLQTYQDTSDFLMMYTYPKETLKEMMSNAGSTTTTGPIGPKLRLLLKTMGYDVKSEKDYTPPTSANDSSHISFNLVLSLACVLLTLVYNIYF